MNKEKAQINEACVDRQSNNYAKHGNAHSSLFLYRMEGLAQKLLINT